MAHYSILSSDTKAIVMLTRKPLDMQTSAARELSEKIHCMQYLVLSHGLVDLSSIDDALQWRNDILLLKVDGNLQLHCHLDKVFLHSEITSIKGAMVMLWIIEEFTLATRSCLMANMKPHVNMPTVGHVCIILEFEERRVHMLPNELNILFHKVSRPLYTVVKSLTELPQLNLCNAVMIDFIHICKRTTHDRRQLMDFRISNDVIGEFEALMKNNDGLSVKDLFRYTLNWIQCGSINRLPKANIFSVFHLFGSNIQSNMPLGQPALLDLEFVTHRQIEICWSLIQKRLLYSHMDSVSELATSAISDCKHSFCLVMCHLLNDTFKKQHRYKNSFCPKSLYIDENAVVALYHALPKCILMSDCAREEIRKHINKKTQCKIGPLSSGNSKILIVEDEEGHSVGVKNLCKIQYRPKEFTIDTLKIICGGNKHGHTSSLMSDKKELSAFFQDPGLQLQTHPTSSKEIETKPMVSKISKETEDIDEVLYQYGQYCCHQELVIAPLVSLRNHFEEMALGKRYSLPEEMKYEALRLKSYFRVNVKASCVRLAAAGFYATSNGDETKCFSCSLTYKGWKLLDNPMQIHRLISPDCGFLNGLDTNNVPIDSSPFPEITSLSVTSADSMTGDISTTRHPDVISSTATPIATDHASACSAISSAIDNSHVLTSRYPNQTDAIASNPTSTMANLAFNNAVYPHYSDIESRIASFLTWPKDHCKKPADLVLVGFFYAGYSDCVRCFVCGVGLRTWEAEDDPWVEHVRWRSSCDYIKMVKGDQFIFQALSELGKTERQGGTETNNRRQNENGLSNILSREACKKALEMGFTSDSVNKHAAEIVGKQGTESLQLEALVEKILADKENSQSEADPQAEAQEKTTQRSSNEPQGAILDHVGDRMTEPPQIRSESTAKGTDNHETKRDILTITGEAKNIKPGAASSVQLKLAVSDVSVEPSEQNHGFENDDEGYEGSSGMDDITPLETKSLDLGYGSAIPIFQTERLSHTDTMLSTITEENREMKESSLCKICLDDPSNIVFLPCGHLVACVTCAPALERCPVCRSSIRGTVRVHLADMASVAQEG